MEQVPVTFVTGNPNKLREVQEIMGKDFAIVNKKVDLPELQGEAEEISAEKCRLASIEVGGPVIVEDTMLCFKALKGLPGPYIKWFLEKLGHDGLNRLLVGFDTKDAWAQCTFAYRAGPDATETRLFIGKTEGQIVPARGPTNFGWDPIFEPIGYDQTYAEMTSELKNSLSHRGRALSKLRDFFTDIHS